MPSKRNATPPARSSPPKRRARRRTRARTGKDGLDKVPNVVPPVAVDLASQILAVVPEANTEGQIDWERLKSALAPELVDDPDRYGFSWAGRRDAARLLQVPTRATLTLADLDAPPVTPSRHAFIEAENLETLKLLYKPYFGRIKMIYLDPPYNTGTDLVYEDDYRDPLDRYLVMTGQAKATGELLTGTPEKAGRFHSAWLTMMYPRLFYARQLLREDGVLFVSIDDREVHNLRLLLNEIFGEENFVGTFVWNSKKGGGSDSATAVTDHEYVLCYSRLPSQPILSRIELEPRELDKEDDKGAYRKGRELNKWGANSRREDRPTMFFPIPGPGGEDVYPIRSDGDDGCWRWGKKRMLAIVAAGDAEFVQRDDGRYRVYEKIRSTDAGAKPFRTWMLDVGQTADGSRALKELFDGKRPYDFPKPLQLVKHLVTMGTTSADDIVLDFFAGSCTTAQAVWEVNLEDGGDRRVICAQLPEPTPKKSEARKMRFSTLAAVGRDRMALAARMLIERDQLEGDDAAALEFRVFTLRPSNWRLWEGLSEAQEDEYADTMALFADPLIGDWRPIDVIYETAIKEGFTLAIAIARVPDAKRNAVYVVNDPERNQTFRICLDNTIHKSTLTNLALGADDVFVCRDVALSDSQAANLKLQCRLKVI